MAAYKGVVATADYTFDKTAKTITFSANYTGIALSDIMYITNVKSATATVIYDPSNAALGGSLSGLVLTLAYDTSAMLSADPLQIIVAMGTLAAKVDASGTLLEATATRSSSGTFFTQTITNYKWVNVQIDGIVNATLVFETSNDNSIWYFCVLSDISSTSGVIKSNPSADSQYAGPISAKYFRVRTLSYTSGTITVTAEFSTLATGQNASGVVSGQVGALTLDGLGNSINSNSTTYSSKRGLDVNVLGTLGTAFSTAGKVDVKAADGDVFVRQATAANLNATVVGTGTFVVQATLAAETTKAIGVVRTSDGAGNLLTTNSTTYTAKFALDNNLLGTLGTAFSTAGKVDVKGADGDVFIRQATASNLNMTEASAANILTKLTAGAASMVKLEDVASADADAGCPAMAVRKATPANTSNADGDYEMLQMSAGRLWVDASGVTLTANSTLTAETTKVIGTINVAASQTIAVTNTGTFATQSTPVTQADTFMLGGVNVKEINAVTPLMGAGNTGTGSLRVTIATDQATVATTPAGNVAHDAVDSGNPVKVGAKAIASLKTTTLVSSADRTDNQSDLDGALIVRDQFPLGDLLSERVTDTGGSSTAFSNFNAVASTRNFITAIVVYNSSATAGTVDFRDGTAGTVLWTMPVPAGGGSVLPMGSAPYFRTTANTALAYDVSGALSTITISVSGFQSKL